MSHIRPELLQKELWDEATEKYSIFEVAGGALTLKGDEL